MLRYLARGTAALALVTLCIPAPTAAQLTVNTGIDLFTTQPNTGTQAAVAFPPGFFCAGSPGFVQTISFHGVPLTTNPQGVVGNADTVVERLKDAVLVPGGTATVPIVVRAMHLKSDDIFSVPCRDGSVTTWRVKACTCGIQPITNINITRNNDTTCNCGTFSGDLEVNVCLTFIEETTCQIVGPIEQRVFLNVNMPWCDRLLGAQQARQVFHVDTDCSGDADLAVPCTTNFFPGAFCGGGGGGCANTEPNCHAGPSPDHLHCVNPTCQNRGVIFTPIPDPIPTDPTPTDPRLPGTITGR